MLVCVVCGGGVQSDRVGFDCGNSNHVAHRSCVAGWVRFWGRLHDGRVNCPICRTHTTTKKITTTVYLDMKCSHCKEFDETVGPWADNEAAMLGFERVYVDSKSPYVQTDFPHAFKTNRLLHYKEYTPDAPLVKMFCVMCTKK